MFLFVDRSIYELLLLTETHKLKLNSHISARPASVTVFVCSGRDEHVAGTPCCRQPWSLKAAFDPAMSHVKELGKQEVRQTVISDLRGVHFKCLSEEYFCISAAFSQQEVLNFFSLLPWSRQCLEVKPTRLLVWFFLVSRLSEGVAIFFLGDGVALEQMVAWWLQMLLRLILTRCLDLGISFNE